MERYLSGSGLGRQREKNAVKEKLSAFYVKI
jgi:hypothetical protein